MSDCLREGDLRAYLDRELPPEEIARAAAHLGACVECHGRYTEVSARTARVSALMGALDAPALYAPAPAPNRRWIKVLPAAALALAAGLALAFAIAPKRQNIPRPVPTPHAVRDRNAVQQAAVTAPEATPAMMSMATARTVKHRRPAAAQQARNSDYYLALDDEPIETGVVMRVALGNDMQADVIYDDGGRPRAIRPVQGK